MNSSCFGFPQGSAETASVLSFPFTPAPIVTPPTITQFGTNTLSIPFGYDDFLSYPTGQVVQSPSGYSSLWGNGGFAVVPEINGSDNFRTYANGGTIQTLQYGLNWGHAGTVWSPN